MKWYLRVKNPFCATTQIWKNSSANVLQKNNRSLLLKAIAVIRSGLFLYYKMCIRDSWKIYRIAKMIIGRKRMRRLMMTALTILVIGACYCGSHPGTYEKVSGIYQEQKTNINSAVRNLTKSALTDAANKIGEK